MMQKDFEVSRTRQVVEQEGYVSRRRCVRSQTSCVVSGILGSGGDYMVPRVGGMPWHQRVRAVHG
jgi:hypothetical protein